MKNIDKPPTAEDLALEKRTSTYGGSETKAKRRATGIPGSPDKLSKGSPTLGKAGTQGEKNAAMLSNLLEEIVPDLEDRIEELGSRFASYQDKVKLQIDTLQVEKATS